MTSADCLVLLSDVDGLYTAAPARNPDAALIPVVPRITPEIEAMAGGAGSELSRGGMRTKIEAAQDRDRRRHPHGHRRRARRRTRSRAHRAPARAAPGSCTPSNPVTARKKWIAGSLEPAGVLHRGCRRGAGPSRRARACCRPASSRVEGTFERGDAVCPAVAGRRRDRPWPRRLRSRRRRRDRRPFDRAISRPCWAMPAAPRWCTATTWRSLPSQQCGRSSGPEHAGRGRARLTARRSVAGVDGRHRPPRARPLRARSPMLARTTRTAR